MMIAGATNASRPSCTTLRWSQMTKGNYSKAGWIRMIPQNGVEFSKHLISDEIFFCN